MGGFIAIGVVVIIFVMGFFASRNGGSGDDSRTYGKGLPDKRSDSTNSFGGG